MSPRRRPSAIDVLAAAVALADADLVRLALDLREAVADAARELAGRADDHHVAARHRGRAVENAARGHLRAAHATRVPDRTRLLVLAHDVQVLDHDLPVAR